MAEPTRSFLSTLRALFSSRKFLVFVAGLIVAIGGRLGFDLDPVLVGGVLLLAAVLIGATAWEDVAAKAGSVLAPFDDANIELPATIEDDLRAELRAAQEENGRLRELAAGPGPKLARIIIVNGKGTTTTKERLTYDDVLELAGKRDGATVTFKSSLSGGTAIEGESFEVVDGMVINAIHTGGA